MPFKLSYFILLSLFLSFGCNNIKSKGLEVASSSKKELLIQKNDLVDKVINKFDPYHPDTKYNKQRFKDFFNFAPTGDVSNIYCYSDELGIDHKYQFSFTCDTSTVIKIVNNLSLVKSSIPDEFGSNLWANFEWWDKEKILKLIPYSKKSDQEIYDYLWYDPVNRKAYYFSFDL